jgi:hypothetical protein
MVVLKHGIESKLVLIANPVSWSFKGHYYQNYHSIPGTRGQGNQAIVRRAFARAAMAAFGTRGKVPLKGKSMPAVAAAVASGVAGSPEVQSLKSTTQANKERRRTLAHEAASARWGGAALVGAS